MKKTRLLPLLILLLACLCVSASASSYNNGPAGQAYVSSVTDANGAVSALTDGNTSTTWTKSSSSYGADLTINLYSATVGEIWVRNGHYYSQNYYNHYDRPDVISVTLWYSANRYTSTSVTYRYRMSDVYRPNASSAAWYNGYQRLLLPQQYSGVTRIELTIESVIQGYGRTGATLTDVIVATGTHTTATPRPYTTATPRPYVQYVTPSPTPFNYHPTREPAEVIIPTPTRGVVLLTPEPTATPLVELITPVPQTTSTPVVPTVDYPSKGVLAKLLKRVATRSGPSVGYDEPGSFFKAGDYVNVISKAVDPNYPGIYWYQLELQDRGQWIRAYTHQSYLEIDPNSVPTENAVGDTRRVLQDHRVYYGPGTHYKMYTISMLYEGARATIYDRVFVDGVEWAQIHYYDGVIEDERRAWVPMEALSDWSY